MITLVDIKDFFNIENADLDAKNEEFKKKPFEDKVQEGKAIKGLMLDADYRTNDDGDEIRLLHVEENLSEFKVGDRVVLCTDNESAHICECLIANFREDGDIEIAINPYNYTTLIDTYTDCRLVLVKQNISMSAFYANFCSNIEFYKTGYFENHIINKIPHPQIVGDYNSALADNEISYKNIFDVSLNTSQLQAVTRCELAKDYFLIQGPPGTGKSFLLASHILDGITNKKKIVVVAPTHMAVNNLLLKVAELSMELLKNSNVSDTRYVINNSIYKCGQSYNARDLFVTDDNEIVKIPNIQYLNIHFFNTWQWSDKNGELSDAPLGYVIGMTPYSLQSRRAHGLEFDELVIDEAGQMTIPVAMMALVTYNKIILAGDHKQLPPIISENFENEELSHSIFKHLIRSYNSIMLDVSFRMNDVICDFVSTLFYDNKLKSYNGSKRLNTALEHPLYSAEYPIVFMDCDESGKQYSIKEAIKVIEIIEKYIKSGIYPEDIAVLAPFRAQCSLIRKKLTKYFTKDIRDKIVIDTVDRMQGQERQIIIYSFVSGDIEYMTQMADFLYNTNKLNVAFSRAKTKLIMIGNKSAMIRLSHPTITRIFEYPKLKFV